MRGTFNIEANNYGPEETCINNILVRAKVKSASTLLKKNEIIFTNSVFAGELWEKCCVLGYGIVIEPEKPFGGLVGDEVIQVNLWIYANTFGVYLEEVIVEINDLTPFCFNLIVEVVGLPIELPFAVNTLLETPTIR